jgi:hypothetical protein
MLVESRSELPSRVTPTDYESMSADALTSRSEDATFSTRITVAHRFYMLRTFGMWSNLIAPHFTTEMLHLGLSGLQSVDPHELERWRVS